MDGAIEFWREPPLYPGVLISSWGHLIGRRGRLVSGGLDRDGYRWFFYSENGKTRRLSFHALVMSAFLGSPKDGQERDHIDRNRQNNALSNLRYVTHAENMASSDSGGHRTSRCRLSYEDAVAIRASTDRPYVIAKRYGISSSHCASIRSGRLWPVSPKGTADQTQIETHEVTQ